ncbi:hypothetical protein EVAR_21305_1 [Eumeta japonica]|uniref:Uncharacterized protein n=1 Tax=Eumeta variegata TaxID=151549 RepID=A0A4C1WQ05_EUMVA|nr:hypothetical protein EVAR_21305_1 [Eumeta japonica]
MASHLFLTLHSELNAPCAVSFNCRVCNYVCGDFAILALFTDLRPVLPAVRANFGLPRAIFAGVAKQTLRTLYEGDWSHTGRLCSPIHTAHVDESAQAEHLEYRMALAVISSAELNSYLYATPIKRSAVACLLPFKEFTISSSVFSLRTSLITNNGSFRVQPVLLLPPASRSFGAVPPPSGSAPVSPGRRKIPGWVA